MLPATVLVLFALLGQTAEEADLILLKDGTKRTGVIIEENAETVVIQITIKGRKGETAISTPVTLPREDIQEIRRMSDEEREKGKAKAEAFEDRAWEREKRLSKIAVEPATVEGRAGFVAAGDLFEVRTTCDEDFARETCDALQQAYEGYLRHFKLRRKATTRLPVLIFADRAEYDACLTARYGKTVGNPALYDGSDNLILAYNGVQRSEEARIRREIREESKKIDGFKKMLSEVEEQNDTVTKADRKAVNDAAAEAANRLRREGRATNEAIRDVERWKREQLDRVNQRKRAADQRLAGLRKRASDAIALGNRAIRHNEGVLRDENREMFEILFHECFHAFARNRLFTDKEIPHWLNEGMASYFEMSVVEDDELIHGAAHPGFVRLYRERGGKGLMPSLASVLRDDGNIFLVEHAGMIDRSNRAYAVSWALAHYLSTRMSPEQMDAYVGSVARGADPADALAKALGIQVTKIDEAVRAHVAALR